MIFSKEFLIEEGGKTISNEIAGKSRWSIEYERIFEHEGKFYRTFYRMGATESQDESPYEYDEDQIECEEVFPHTETIVVYKTVRP
jgi:hypothetical protein